MSDRYQPKKGDRVRGVLEGEVTRADEYDPWFNLVGMPLYSEGSAVVSFVKVEPPVEVFKPGDVVRNISTGATYAIGQNGWIMLRGSTGRYGGSFTTGDVKQFTSDAFETIYQP
jgi:hypothetical protein